MAEPTRPSAQANEVTYELHTLGWKAFQDLCATIAGEVWGQTIQTFLPTKDGGRDGAFTGLWQPRQGEAFEGAFVVQCKFTAKRDKRLHVSDIEDEIVKAERLASRGLATNYVLMTNAGLTAEAEAEMRTMFQAIPGISRFAGFGGEWLSRVIRESSRLRMLVPRVYGLGDLAQILDQRAYDQATQILSALGDDLTKFVITDAFRKSAKAIVEHGFVLLLGEPASGKSTIAAALAVGATDTWGCSTIKVRDADDFAKHWNPNEPKQFFWVDDAFGATQYDWASVAEWNRTFPHVHTAIQKGARVLFTSRDYVFRAARNDLKESSLPLIRESQVVIHVDALTRDEKEQILYNHIKLGTQPKEFKRAVKPFLPGIAAHLRFLPEVARRLGSSVFTTNLVLTKPGLARFVECPLDFLIEVVRNLDRANRAALALIFMKAGAIESPLSLSQGEQHALDLMGSSIGDVRAALNSLKDSLVVQVLQEGSTFWRFKHPTIRDAFGAIVAEDRELLDIYLCGTPADKLISEVSCGQTDIQGIRVIVPPSRYEAVVGRLAHLRLDSMDNRDRLHRFLARRCDRAFLHCYLLAHPEFLQSLNVNSPLSAYPSVGVLLTLHEVGLLPEPDRVRFVEAASEVTIETPDAGVFESESIASMFKPSEFEALREKVREKLLPELDGVVEDWEGRYSDPNESPDDYFEPLAHTLRRFKDGFESDGEAILLIEQALDQIEGSIEWLRSTAPGEPEDDDYYGGVSSLPTSTERSVFDDVDD